MSGNKEDLELKKLELEIKELARPIWLRPAFLGAFVPIVLAILALASTMLTGLFDKRMAELRDQREKLEEEVAGMIAGIQEKEARIEDLIYEIEDKEDELRSIEDERMDDYDQVKISAEEREIGRLLFEIQDFYEECGRLHPLDLESSAIEKLKQRRDFYNCLIAKLEAQE